MSNWFIWALIAQYLVIAIVCLFEHNWARVLYYVSAASISVAVLWGMR